MKIPIILSSVVIALTFAGTAAAQYGQKEVAKATVVAALAADDRFTTLVAAVTAAGLADTLSGAGPFTVFAPTNDAFAKLPAGTVESLLLPENKDKLVSILTYHVVPAKVMAADVKTMKAPTVQGSEASLVVADGTVKIDAATVTETDIKAGNGVVHVIDAVIMPAK
jgi:uncharacterized surface protein with fasciclin (FAS1) repeats